MKKITGKKKENFLKRTFKIFDGFAVNQLQCFDDSKPNPSDKLIGEL